MRSPSGETIRAELLRICPRAAGLLPTARPPEILYHYCSAEALKGIVESRQLWMGSASFFNDPLEWSWISKVARGLIEEKFAPLRPRAYDPYRLVLKFLESSRVENEHRRFHTFAASFSSILDDLSQWRAYATDGLGYCIGFATSELKLLPQQVVYSAEVQSQVVETIFQSEIGNRLKPKSTYAPERCIAVLNRLRPLMKSCFYRQEMEWRIVAQWDFGIRQTGKHIFPTERDVRIRLRNGVLKPYVPLQLSPRAIRSILCGPRLPNSPPPDYLFRPFLRRHGFDIRGVSFGSSEVPYSG